MGTRRRVGLIGELWPNAVQTGAVFAIKSARYVYYYVFA